MKNLKISLLAATGILLLLNSCGSDNDNELPEPVTTFKAIYHVEAKRNTLDGLEIIVKSANADGVMFVDTVRNNIYEREVLFTGLDSKAYMEVEAKVKTPINEEALRDFFYTSSIIVKNVRVPYISNDATTWMSSRVENAHFIDWYLLTSGYWTSKQAQSASVDDQGKVHYEYL